MAAEQLNTLVVAADEQFEAIRFCLVAIEAADSAGTLNMDHGFGSSGGIVVEGNCLKPLGVRLCD